MNSHQKNCQRLIAECDVILTKPKRMRKKRTCPICTVYSDSRLVKCKTCIYKVCNDCHDKCDRCAYCRTVIERELKTSEMEELIRVLRARGLVVDVNKEYLFRLDGNRRRTSITLVTVRKHTMVHYIQQMRLDFWRSPGYLEPGETCYLYSKKGKYIKQIKNDNDRGLNLNFL